MRRRGVFLVERRRDLARSAAGKADDGEKGISDRGSTIADSMPYRRS
jgi:hypothetical protein